jgi:hypothetical protein
MSFAKDLGVPYNSLPEDLKRPSYKPAIILTAKAGTLTGRMFFSGGIQVTGGFYVPFIYSTFLSAPGETIPRDKYKVLRFP